MAASKQNPVCTIYIVSGGTKYNVTPAFLGMDKTEDEGQIAQSVTIRLGNVKVEGEWLSGIFKARDRIYVYADDGETKDEVFRGFLWERTYNSSLEERELKFKCYDQLIYTQESEISEYFSSGKSTKSVFESLCRDWGITMNYSYKSITHGKLVLRGHLSDVFTADILDLVKERTGKKYVIRSEKDVMHIMSAGTNTTVYRFEAGKNVVATASGWTMDGVVTKVIIVGKADDNGREPIEATVKGDTKQYGTLQKIYDRDSDTTLKDAKLEAQKIIDENGKPKWEYELAAPDIPWIRRGDKVYVNAGDIKGNKIVTAVDRSIDKNQSRMTLTMRDA